MKDVNLNTTASILRSQAQHNYIVPQPKDSLTFPGVIVWNSILLIIKMTSSFDIFIKRCINWMKD